MKKNTKILNVIAENIRDKRKLQKLSQEELAELAECHRTYIGMVERSEINITITNLDKIAKALKVTVIDLLS